MTVADVWLRLVDPEVPRDPYRALDLVMETLNCERPKALKALYEAAADWIEELRQSRMVDWDITPDQIVERIRNGKLNLSGCGGIPDPISMISYKDADADRNHRLEKWRAWCDRVTIAREVIRELQAVHAVDSLCP